MRVFLSLTAIAVLVVSVSGCGGSESASIEAKSMEQIHAENGVPVKTEIVEANPLESEFYYYSVLTGFAETTASAMVSDKVESIGYKVGDSVVIDAIVVTFPTDNPAAQYYQIKIAYEHAGTTLDRIKNLYENGGISLQEYDNARTQSEVAKANWDTVRQTVTVKAPISGIITNMAVRESDNVKPGDILFTVSKMSKLKTRIWVSEGQIDEVKVGNTATASWRDIILQGEVVQVDMSLDSSNQAFGVVVEFENPENSMMSGVNAEVLLKGKKNSAAITTARKNVITDKESSYVYLADNDVSVKRPVTLGRGMGLDVEIVDGLNPGDCLVTEGQMLLEDNMKISIKN